MLRLLWFFPLVFLFGAANSGEAEIQFQYTGTDTIIQAAVMRANTTLHSPLFYRLLEAHTDTFDFANINGVDLARFFRTAQPDAEVLPYKTLTKYSRSTAYTSFDGRIFLNTKRLDRPIDDIAITLIHECVHVLDYRNRGKYMGHRGNNPNGKSQSAPYAIELIADSVLRTLPADKH